MIARVPLFARLDGTSMSRILNLLQARVVEAETVVFHKGDPASEMYFIATGEVLVELEPVPVSLSDGDFFGELALLQDAPRGATVRTVTVDAGRLRQKTRCDFPVPVGCGLRCSRSVAAMICPCMMKCSRLIYHRTRQLHLTTRIISCRLISLPWILIRQR